MEFSNEQIRGQLARILQSSDFNASARLKSFFSFVVEETLAGRGDEIKAYTIAISVFGRDSKFDPLLDPIVRVEAGKLRKLLERYYLLNPREEVLISIPLGNYIPLFKRNPNAAGVRKTDFKPGIETITAQPLNTWQALKLEKKPLLLIIPPDNYSNLKEITNFTLGLAEDLLMRMESSNLFNVLFAPILAAEGGADPFELVELAAESKARFIVHGRVQSTETLLRVYVSLTDASNRRRIWTERFDTPLDGLDLVKLQEDLSNKVWAVLADTFGVIARLLMQESVYLGQEEIGSYEASLLFGVWEATWDISNFEQARDALERSINQSPSNPVLLGQLSRLCSADYEHAIGSIKDNLDMSMDLAKLSVSKDNNYDGGHIALAHSLFVRDNPEQLGEVINIILNMPGCTPYAQSVAGFFHAMAFDLERGLKIVEKAASLNPDLPGYHRMVPFFHHFYNKNYEAALKETLLLNIPTNPWDSILRIMVYHKLNRQKLLQGAKQRLFEVKPEFKKYQEQILKGMLFTQERVDSVNEILHDAGV